MCGVGLNPFEYIRRVIPPSVKQSGMQQYAQLIVVESALESGSAFLMYLVPIANSDLWVSLKFVSAIAYLIKQEYSK
jgi:hypothetical protein